MRATPFTLAKSLALRKSESNYDLPFISILW
jgi:hypothetical protein